MVMDIHEKQKRIGPFPGVKQIVPPAPDEHELLIHPVSSGATPATLTYHGGPTIAQPKVWNVYINQFPDNVLDFDAFSKAVIEYGYLDGMSVYGSGRGTFLGSRHVIVNLLSPVKDSFLQSTLETLIAAGTLPAPDNSTAYALIMPPGSIVQDDASGEQSCSAFCGYHSRSKVRGVYYWIVCDPSCSGCHGSFTPQQGRQMVYAHELAEWVSDPQGTGWYNDQSGQECGDECAWIEVVYGNWVVQPEATNGKGCYTPSYQPPTIPPPQPQPQPATVDRCLAIAAHVSSVYASRQDWPHWQGAEQAISTIKQFAKPTSTASDILGLLLWCSRYDRQQNQPIIADGVIAVYWQVGHDLQAAPPEDATVPGATPPTIPPLPVGS